MKKKTTNVKEHQVINKSDVLQKSKVKQKSRLLLKKESEIIVEKLFWGEPITPNNPLDSTMQKQKGGGQTSKMACRDTGLSTHGLHDYNCVVQTDAGKEAFNKTIY